MLTAGRFDQALNGMPDPGNNISQSFKQLIMAKQKGIIRLKGTIGNITFYKSRDGFLAREKTSITADRVANDPAFERTRENGAEFGRAGIAGKILRTALRALLIHASDSRLVGRLTREMVKVVQADITNPRGRRNVIDGEAELLEGFEFNNFGKLGASFYAPFTPSIDRVSGELRIDIPAYVPLNMVNAPTGASHYRIQSAGVEIDFENNQYVVDVQTSGTIPWDASPTALLTLTNTVTANSSHPLFLAFGVEFFQQVNGQEYALKNGAFNSLALVKVLGV